MAEIPIASENIVVKLLKTKCLSILLYGLEISANTDIGKGNIEPALLQAAYS